MKTEKTEVTVIGAGPAGSIASALLARRGIAGVAVEKTRFPRFSIGESLLPHCMEFIEEAGMIDAAKAAGFQRKRGALFCERDKSWVLDFADNFSGGYGWTWEVQRAEFDDLLAKEAVRQGADIRFEHGVEAIDFSDPSAPVLEVQPIGGERYRLQCKFVLDASGFGRVLPRLMGTEMPVDLPPRQAIFTHIEDRISAPDYDRELITAAIHPLRHDLWYWLIPFSNGRASLGFVGSVEALREYRGEPVTKLKQAVSEEPRLARFLENAVFDTRVTEVTNYAVAVESLTGPGYALLGNSGEFLDPVFSSGVTLAMKAASLSVGLVARQLNGEAVDWNTEFAEPIRSGLNVFKHYVNAWYDGSLRHVFFSAQKTPQIHQMVCSVLGGDVWDQNNPYVKVPERRLRALCATCAPRANLPSGSPT